jgi:hypothetical protein
MVLKFFGFALLYLAYMALVFAGMALLVKYTYEFNLEKLLPPAVSMIVLLIVLIVLIGLPPVFFSLHSGRPSSWQKRLLQTGQESNAQILQVEDTGFSLGNPDLSFVARLTLRVLPDGLVPFEVQLETPVSRAAIPQCGDQVRIKFDPSDRLRVVLI